VSDPDPRPPGLAVPPGRVLDWISLDRLARRLSRAPAGVAGVAAPPGPLPPGASHRTHAERLALVPDDAGEVVERAPAGAAVLWRDPAAHGGPVLVDPGTHTHDPGAPPGAVHPAVASARSPFPSRPVVVLVQTGPGALDPRVGPLVNRLVELGVEARLAGPTVPPGPHLTRPCTPEPGALLALAADVVVPLDATADAEVRTWLAALGRPPALVEIDAHGTGAVVVGTRSAGPTAAPCARIGLDATAAQLVTLLVRISSSPPPLNGIAVAAP